jgi:hypothetical protein
LNIEDFTYIISLKNRVFSFLLLLEHKGCPDRQTTFNHTCQAIGTSKSSSVAQGQYQKAILELVLKMGTQV